MSLLLQTRSQVIKKYGFIRIRKVQHLWSIMQQNEFYKHEEVAPVSEDPMNNPPVFTHEQYEKLLNLIQGTGVNLQPVSSLKHVTLSAQFD